MTSPSDMTQQLAFATSSLENIPSGSKRHPRITRACDTCRRKKIKCDIAQTKPCTTCQQYGWECTFNDVTKKRGPPKGYIEHLEARLRKLEELLQEVQTRKRKRAENDDDPLAIRSILNYEQDTKLSKSTKDFLVFKYFDIPQNALPIIDRNDFCHSYLNQSVPCSLVYALCAYTCYRLEKNDPIFRSTRHRKEVFHYAFRKALEMIKNEYLVARLATLQAIVIVCSHPIFLMRNNQSWTLLGMAVRMAQELGIHNVLTVDNQHFSQETVGLYKRLWCCVYVMERWNAATMSRPLAIIDSECDMGLQNISAECPNFISLVSLSSILGDINRQIYSPYTQCRALSTTATAAVVQSLQTRLDSWWEALPAEYRKGHDDNEAAVAITTTTATADTTRGPSPILMRLCYYGITLMLHRSFIDKQHGTLLKCTEIAKKVTLLARSVPRMDALCFSFNFICYSVYQAMVVHWHNSYHSDDPATAADAQEYVRISLEECILALCDTLLVGDELRAVLTGAISNSESRARSKKLLTSIGPPYLEPSWKGSTVLDYPPTWAQLG